MAKKKYSAFFNQIDLLSTATVSPTSIHTYYRRADGFHSTKRFDDNKVNLKHNKHNGELSDKAVKRIKNAIEWLLIRSSPQRVYNRQQDKVFFFRLNFITLTLPSKQIHSDKEITARCLGNFLNVLRNTHGVTDYLWKAETQSNGNIHFHVTTNTFIHWQAVRQAWVNSVELLGYVSAFQKKFHHRNPPCTEIRKVKHIRRLAAYLSKYMAKNKSFAPIGELRKINSKVVEVLYSDKVYRDEKAYCKAGVVIGSVLSARLRKIESNLWGCSQSISKCKPFSFDCNSVQWEGLSKVLSEGNLKHVKGEYVHSYYGSVYSEARKLSAGLFEDMTAHAKLNEVSFQFSDDKVLQYIS